MTALASLCGIYKSSPNPRESIEDVLDSRRKEWGYLFIYLNPTRSLNLNGALKRSSLTAVSTFGTLAIMS